MPRVLRTGVLYSGILLIALLMSSPVSLALDRQHESSYGGPARVTAGLVVLYDFAPGEGDLVPDVSGVDSPLDLEIVDPGAVTWLPGGGISLDTATIVRSAGPATKIIDAVTGTNAITVEAWLAPGSVAQNGPARMVTCSGGLESRNFTLGQGVHGGGDDRYVARLRTTATDDNGTPETSTPTGSLTTDLTHVVYTRDPSGSVTIYLDSGLARSGFTGGTCANWDAGYPLALGNELSEDRPWLGVYFLVAVYDRALSSAEIAQNFAAGSPGLPLPAAPVVTSVPVTAGTIGQPYEYDVEASGNPAPVFSLSVAPEGMTIDAVTGMINWTPDESGDQAVEVVAGNSEGTDSQAFTVTVYADNPVQVVIWHGSDQRVGHLGGAQPDFNVLGNASSVADIASLAYRVNDGVFLDLTMGPDDKRLAAEGDFNADIPIVLLREGLNTVTIRALGTTGQVSTAVVNLTLETGGDYTLPATISWSDVIDPQDVGQYIDGHWQLEGDVLHAVLPGYDRLFLVGKEQWQDYEILVPITINEVFPGTAGLGIIMRFTGHIVGGHRDWPLAQPKYGYQPFGGIGWLRWRSGPANDPTMQFYYGDYDATENFGYPAKLLADPSSVPFGAAEMTESFGKKDITLGSTYWMRMRCETEPDAPGGDGVTLYSWKIWEDGTLEPSDWIWQVTQESQYALRQGGVALVAHHVDASFGDIQVREIPGVSNVEVRAEPHRFVLDQNHPNPFNPLTEINFSLPHDGNAILKVYDLRGRVATTLASGFLSAGPHTVTWDARRHPSGVYFYRLETPGFNETKKMILLK